VRVFVPRFATTEKEWFAEYGLMHLQDTGSAQKRLKEMLTRARQLAVDVIVFPELSVPETSIRLLQSWSQQTGGIIVGGTHYAKRDADGHTDMISRCPIIIGGEIVFAEKQVPSPFEVSSVLGQGLTPGEELPIIKNSTIGNFSVLICSDYLAQDIRGTVLGEGLDILFVVACQRNSDTYHQRMSIDCEEVRDGVFVVYSNLVHPQWADGRSALFGMMDNLYLSQLVDAGYTNGIPPHKVCELASESTELVVDIDITNARPQLPRTIHSRPNVVVVPSSARTTDLSAFTRRIAHDDDRYRRISELFVPPVEYHAILKKLETRKMVFIVGDPGIGKTYTAARILLHYYERGYEPVWFTGLEREERVLQRQLLAQFEPRNRQIIYFEDPFGRVVFERRDSIAQVFGPIADRLRDIDARVIVTSRREVFEQFAEESLTAAELATFKEEMSIVKPSYPKSALQEIADRGASECKWYGSEQCRAEVRRAISEGRLTTPFAIRDLIVSTTELIDHRALRRRIARRQQESIRFFASELIECSPATKLSLSLVFLLGLQGQFLLVQWFSTIWPRLAGQHGFFNTTSFLQEIRSQLGHRVEQYGTWTVGLRFTHPTYEEAFVMSAAKDETILSFLREIVSTVGKTYYFTVLSGIRRYAKKYPLMAELLFEWLIDDVTRQEELKNVKEMILQLIGAFRQKTLLKLLTRLTSQVDLYNLIDRERNAAVLALALKCLYHLRVLGIPGFQEEVEQKLDWDALYRHIVAASHFQNVIDAIIWALEFRRDAAEKILLTIPFPTLQRRFDTLDPENRRRAFELLETNNLAWLSERLRANVSRGWNWQERLLTLLDAPHSEHTPGVIVDEGAGRAIKTLECSLLPIGIVDVVGQFQDGEPIVIYTESGRHVAVGITEYSAEEIVVIRGHHSSAIPELLGTFRGPSVIRGHHLLLAGDSTPLRVPRPSVDRSQAV
jgi:predicted amidohydrolase